MITATYKGPPQTGPARVIPIRFAKQMAGTLLHRSCYVKCLGQRIR